MARKTHAKALRAQHWLQSHSLGTTKLNYFPIWMHQLFLRMWAQNVNISQYRLPRRIKSDKQGSMLKEGPIYIRTNANQVHICTWVHKQSKGLNRKSKSK
jgi:hypothetical protein